MKERAYLTLVRPSLEYASSAWSPYTDSDVNRLEQVQKNAARFVCRDYRLTTSTSQLVKTLGWDTLEDRRLLNQSTLLYKFHNNLIHCQPPDDLTPTKSTRSSRRHPQTYQQLQANLLAFNYSYFPRTIRTWNLLPAEVVNAADLPSFKSALAPAIRELKVPSHQRSL